MEGFKPEASDGDGEISELCADLSRIERDIHECFCGSVVTPEGFLKQSFRLKQEKHYYYICACVGPLFYLILFNLENVIIPISV